MSDLESRLMDDIKQAMRDKNTIALDALRAVKANIILLKTEVKGATVSPEQEIAILQRMIKQRKDSAMQFSEQNRNDLAETEEMQMRVIEKYLPQQLSTQELELVIKEIVAEQGVSSIKEMGKIMAQASVQLAGKSDGKSISEMVKKVLS